MATNLDFKLHSMSKDDKGTIFAACQFVSDALFILKRWPGRAAVMKYGGRIVWNNHLDKDGWMLDQIEWFEKSQALVNERITEHKRQRYDKAYGKGAYDREQSAYVKVQS